MVDDKGLEDKVKKLNTVLFLLGAFVLSNSKKNYEQLYTCNQWILYK